MEEIITLFDSGVVFALVASAGGCITRQLTEFKQGKPPKCAYVCADLFIALFLGFYSFWYVMETLSPSLINACVINIVIGYTGSKVIEIAKGVLSRRAKIIFSGEGDQ